MKNYQIDVLDIERLLYSEKFKNIDFFDSTEFYQQNWDTYELKESVALKNIEKVLNLPQEEKKGRISHWELDLENNVLHWTDEVYELLESSREDIGKTSYSTFVSFVHPEDRDMVNKVYWDSVINKRLYILSHRMLIKGRVKHIIEKGRTLYSDLGKPIKSVGIAYDVTGL